MTAPLAEPAVGAPVPSELALHALATLPLSVATRPAARAKTRKWVAQPAFILHTLDYRDSSLIAQAYTRDQGLVTLLAKGAKRHYSQLRGVLHLFQELQVDYSDKAELKLLTATEWLGSVPLIPPARHFSAYYLNELLLRFSPLEEANPLLFAAYRSALCALATAPRVEQVLRYFEYLLLKEGGFINDLQYCHDSQEMVQKEAWYWLDPQNGTRPATPDHPYALRGASLLQLIAGEDASWEPEDLARLRSSLRALISYHLNGRVLNTRKTLHELSA